MLFLDWYVRHMVSRINSHFRYAHEKLQDASIRNLGLIDQMMVDFKTEVPDPSLLKQIFGNMIAGKRLRPSQENGRKLTVRVTQLLEWPELSPREVPAGSPPTSSPSLAA